MTNEIKVVAITVENKDNKEAEQLKHDFTVFSGKAAGVCYMKDDYFETGIDDADKAFKRAVSTAERGHQSPFDHVHMTFKIGTSKAVAMVLNSLGVYATSEKSARYTLMKPDTKREDELYTKWIAKIQTMVLGEFPDYDDAYIEKVLNNRVKKNDDIQYYNELTIKNRNIVNIEADSETAEKILQVFDEVKASVEAPSYKIAQENARYMISVFTKTVLLYTVSYRQAMLIVEYFDKFCCKNINKGGYLGKIAAQLGDFSNDLKEVIGENVIRDNKNQEIRFVKTDKIEKKQMLFDSYTLRYKCSFACLAQLQRHRTIRHEMFLDENNMEFYVPAIVRAYDCEEEWLEDIKSVANVYPQGTMVDVAEQGIVEDFALKCKERLCGRAFKETMDNVRDNTVKFIGAAQNKELCTENAEIIMDMVSVSVDTPDIYNYCVVPRCGFYDFQCTDGCRWGKRSGLRRII